MKISRKYSVYREFLVEQLGDMNSDIWNTYIQSALLITYLKTSEKKKKFLLKYVRSSNIEKVLEEMDRTLEKVDYQRIAEEIRWKIVKKLL